MSTLSPSFYENPPAFQRFYAFPPLPFSAARPSSAEPFIQDAFLDPAQNISSGQALGLFSSGLLLGLSGMHVWQRFLAHAFRKAGQNLGARLKAAPARKWLGHQAGKLSETHFIQRLNTDSKRAWNRWFGPHPQKNAGPVFDPHIDVAPRLAEKPASPAEPPPPPMAFTPSKDTVVYQNYNDSLSSVFRVLQSAPHLGSSLLVYTGVCVLGYLGGTFSQGMQETWVRREESRIRARLIEHLQAIVRQSIRNKLQFDATLREETRQRLGRLLQQAGIPHAESLTQAWPVREPLILQQRFFYQPTHRTVSQSPGSPELQNREPETTFPAGLVQDAPVLRFNGNNPDHSGNPANASLENSEAVWKALYKERMRGARSADKERTLVRDAGEHRSNEADAFVKGFPDSFSPAAPPQSPLPGIQKTALLGMGLFSGAVLHSFLALLCADEHVSKDVPKLKISESIQLKDWETWTLLSPKNRKNFALMLGFFAMSAAASVGKNLLDGLREIEVTRTNAHTELEYQAHNWLTQDPVFHEIAERETVNSEVAQLARDLPELRHDRALLRQHVQSILQNIGRNSAPPYYPMTPTVNLVEARA